MSDSCYVVRNKTKRGRSFYTITQGGQKITEINASEYQSRDKLHIRINYVLLEAAFGEQAAKDFSDLAMLDLAPGINGIATYTIGELFQILIDVKDHGKTEWSVAWPGRRVRR